MDRRSMRGTAALSLLALALLAGCSPESSSGSPSDSPDSSTAPAAAAATPDGTTPDEAPWTTLDGALGRCGPQPPDVADVGFTYRTVKDPRVGALPSFHVGRGRTVAVLLHQTNGGGLCGWLPFASLVAADPRLSALAIDLCQYGESRCSAVDDGTFTDADQTDAVQAAVDYARDRLGARRVVVVGASMGGSVALMSGVVVKGISTAVDLSGPVDWRGLDVIGTGPRAGSRIRVPVLVAMSDDEGDRQVDGSRRIVGNAPQGSRFLPSPSRHGYELVTDVDGGPGRLAEAVLHWIAEPPAAG